MEVKANAETEGSVSNKKPRKAALCKDKMYGCFVKVESHNSSALTHIFSYPSTYTNLSGTSMT